MLAILLWQQVQCHLVYQMCKCCTSLSVGDASETTGLRLRFVYLFLFFLGVLFGSGAEPKLACCFDCCLGCKQSTPQGTKAEATATSTAQV